MEYNRGYLDYEDFRDQYRFKEINEEQGKINKEGAYSNVYYIGKQGEFDFIVKRQYGGRKFYNFVKELSILSSISHRNIIGIEHWTIKNKRFYFSQKYCITLYDYFKSYNVTHQELHEIFKGIYSAVKFLHEHNIVHLDIKLENLV